MSAPTIGQNPSGFIEQFNKTIQSPFSPSKYAVLSIGSIGTYLSATQPLIFLSREDALGFYSKNELRFLKSVRIASIGALCATQGHRLFHKYKNGG